MGTMLDVVKSDYAEKEVLAEALAEASEALESARQESTQAALALGDLLGTPCTKVTEITDIKSLMHSSTSWRS